MDFLPIFSWQPSSAPASLNQRFLTFVANDLNFALSASAQDPKNGERATTALSRLRDLPDASLVRLLAAPETFYRLTRLPAAQSADLPSAVHAWIDVERARLDDSFVPKVSAWSALGDTYFPARSRRERGTLKGAEPSLTWTEVEPFTAPRPNDALAVDFFSPHAERPLQTSAYRSVQLGQLASFQANERDGILDRIAEALRRLAEAMPNAYELVRTVSRVVIPRKDTQNANFYTSVSSRAFIGRTTLVNPHLPDIDVATLSGSLIHESIHDLLYMREIESPPVVDAGATQDIVVQSPWTGGALSVHTYIHACFVWYGLLQFWRSEGAARCYATERVKHHRERAEAGFRQRAVAPLEPHRHHVHADWFEQLAELHA